MRRPAVDSPRAAGGYVRLCECLASFARWLGIRPSRPIARPETDGLALAIDLASLDLTALTVRLASGALAVLVMLALVPVLVGAFVLGRANLIAAACIVSGLLPFLAKGALAAYPSSLAAKRAFAVLKDSPEATNLMIMSIRHDASISKAIAFASRRRSPFSKELRRCVWEVLMGRESGFEEALHSLGRRWAKFSSELNTSLDALVTASREPTKEGRRRALDRANSAMVSGAKRRIEEYALSLSAPSMVMFALGILLPLMVGSFLPMLSWNIWSLDAAEASPSLAAGGLTAETVFVMNILFPAVALLVAMNAISRHPMDTARGVPRADGRLARSAHIAVAGAASAVAFTIVWTFVSGEMLYPLLLLAGTIPWATLLLSIGGRNSDGDNEDVPGDLEDALFQTGARMLEGENFEAALSHAGWRRSSGSCARRLSYRSNVVGQDFESAAVGEGLARGGSNILEGMRIVRDAATKDEMDAGALAMDLSAYLKDLQQIESSLRSRLRPTVSMMKMTTYALGPVVMGVTFAIYMSLASMTGPGDSASSAGAFMVLLGVYLAETDFVVGYFVWGIEGKKGLRALAGSIGLSLLSSELIFVATATVAA